MKKCDKIKDLFGPYLYNSVTPAERANVEEHIEKCEECAGDLRSRQKVLEKLRLDLQTEEMPQKTHDNFAYNVYRKIAGESLQRRSRQVFLRRFIVQPSLVAAALAIGIAIGFLRFHPDSIMVSKSSPTIVKTDEANQRERRAARYVEEFLELQESSSYTRKPDYVVGDGASIAEQPSVVVGNFAQNMLISDSQRQLEDAILSYSLGDYGRALAKFQKLVDHYPNTNDAIEAQKKIKTINAILYAGI